MGGGGLRILGHKRWHVWRRDNIERVERDERAQEQRERENAAERRRVEQERRVETLLRRSARDGMETEMRQKEEGEKEKKEHVNLFRKEEEECAVVLAKGERMARRMSQQQQQNEALGRQGRVPWYAQSGRTLEGTEGGEHASQERERKRMRELALADPLQHMRPPERKDSGSDDGDEVGGGKHGTSRKHKRLSGSDQRRYASRYAVARSKPSSESEDESVSSTSSSDSESESRRRRSGKHKSRKKKKEKEKGRKKSKRESLMDKLRRERNAREEKEKRRAEKLLAGR